MSPTRAVEAVEVAALEELVCDGKASQQERLLAGSAAFAWQALIRAGDAAKITIQPTLDVQSGESFIHTETGDHKSRRCARARDQKLQVVGLAVGVTGKDWADA